MLMVWSDLCLLVNCHTNKLSNKYEKILKILYYLDTSTHFHCNSKTNLIYWRQSMNGNISKSAGMILGSLEQKAFYASRFLPQVQSLYPSMGNEQYLRMAGQLYLSGLLTSIPSDKLLQVGKVVSKNIVGMFKECPTPTEVRLSIAAAALQTNSLSFISLYERAKDFIAIPPRTQAVADRWIDMLIFTTVRHMTRERFIVASPVDWQLAVAETMFCDKTELSAFQVQHPETREVKMRDYRKLLTPNE